MNKITQPLPDVSVSRSGTLRLDIISENTLSRLGAIADIIFQALKFKRRHATGENMTRDLLAESDQLEKKIGSLNRSYKKHIEEAYALSKELSALGYERPWVIVKETESAGGPALSTMFTVEIEKRLRLEIR